MKPQPLPPGISPPTRARVREKQKLTLRALSRPRRRQRSGLLSECGRIPRFPPNENDRVTAWSRDSLVLESELGHSGQLRLCRCLQD